MILFDVKNVITAQKLIVFFVITHYIRIIMTEVPVCTELLLKSY